MSKTATIKDVALVANVSIATVSRVINRVGGVSPNLVLKVEDAVETLNYSPNCIARSLKTANTATLAFLLSNISDPFFLTIARGIEDYIKDFGYNLIVCSIGHSKEKEATYLKLLREKKIDGLILNTTGYNDEMIGKLSRQIPIILSNRRINSAGFVGDFVDTDNFGGAYALTNHLLSLGHKKIGVVNGPNHLSTSSERFSGFSTAMENADIKIDASYRYLCNGNFTVQDGYNGAKTLMEQDNRPTAMILMSSELTFGAMDYFLTHNINIPDDLSFVGFGDLIHRELLYVKPTIVSSNLSGLGTKLAELLLERIQSKGQIFNREVRFTTQLTLGNSTKYFSDNKTYSVESLLP